MDQTLGDREYQLARERKKDHLAYFLKSRYSSKNYFDDMMLMNDSLPDMSISDIDASTEFLGKKIGYPIMINAVTGGFDEALDLNRSLARIAKKHNIPMAVGSQTIALRSGRTESFKIVREIMDNQIVISNLSALSNLESVMSAVEMIGADAVQLHLNVPQELCMKEGDRDFNGVVGNIEDIVSKSPVPVIVKEVGFGISREVAQRLYDIGVRYVDVGGKGGTNFIEIEDLRNEETDFSDMYSWGIPTPLSIGLTRTVSKEFNIIASGGIQKPEDVVKAIRLGSQLTGIAGVLLKVLLTSGYESADHYFDQFLHKFKLIMMMTGTRSVQDLAGIDYRLFGELKSMMKGL